MYTLILNYYELKQIFEQVGTNNIKKYHTKKKTTKQRQTINFNKNEIKYNTTLKNYARKRLA